MTTVSCVDDIAATLVSSLVRTEQRIVFAESCTAGLISASLARIPGVSAVLAGSSVVYQVATKIAWLGIDEALLDNPGPVSREVAELMAVNVLRNTSHAMISASVTGHLGPDAPPELDGIAWCAVAVRNNSGQPIIRESRRLKLLSPAPSSDPLEIRRARQQDAVRQVLLRCKAVIDGSATRDAD
ncbi:MAG: CinA family protein [Planctomycetaceae bacterium]